MNESLILKNVFDKVVSFVALLVLLPVFLIVASDHSEDRTDMIVEEFLRSIITSNF